MQPVIFFDGVCAVCNRTVDFDLKRDPGIFLFCSLTGNDRAREVEPRTFRERAREDDGAFG